MIKENISRNEYQLMKGINASRLKYYYKSYTTGKLNDIKTIEETEAMKFGTAVHKMVLEQNDFWNEYRLLETPINPKTGKAYNKGTKAVLSYIDGLDKRYKYITERELNEINRIKENIVKNDVAISELTNAPKREIAITWTDEETGIDCKALIDYLGEDYAGDLKTTKSIPYSDEQTLLAKWILSDFIRTRNLLQFAFYFDGLRANGIDMKYFSVILAQNNENFDVAVCRLSEESLEIGRKMYRKALMNTELRGNTYPYEEIITV